MDNKNKYCVYMHISPSNKAYIGITSMQPKYRWDYGYGYLHKKTNGEYVQPAIARAIKKYGWDNFKHEILFENLTKEEAEHKERLLIALWETNNPKFGYNIRSGGSVCKHSEESRRRMSDAQKGRVVSEETKEKMRKLHSGENNPMYGTTMSSEQKQILYLANIKPVFCIELNESFESIRAAENKYGIAHSHISAACKGKQKSAGKHPETGEKLHWKYI